MDPLSIGIALAAGGNLLQAIPQFVYGIQDRRKGKAMEEEVGERPQYTIPKSVDQMIGMYGQMAAQGLPGEDLMKQDIQAQTARTVGSAAQLADSPIGALTALGAAKEREMGALRDLQARASQYRAQTQQNYAQAVGQRSGYEQEQWRQNQLLPWEIDMNRAVQLQSQGAGNVMGGFDALGAGLAGAGSTMATAGMYQGMMPNYGPAATGVYGTQFVPGVGDITPQQ
jgi:hypothetical protein